MNGYRVDWVGALSAGVAAAAVFLLVKRTKLTGAAFYIVLGLAVAGLSLALRVLLRYFGI